MNDCLSFNLLGDDEALSAMSPEDRDAVMAAMGSEQPNSAAWVSHAPLSLRDGSTIVIRDNDEQAAAKAAFLARKAAGG